MIRLERRLQLQVTADQRGVWPMRIGMKGKAIAIFGAQQFEDLAEILNPVAVGVARVDTLAVPWCDSPHKQLIIIMAGQVVDGIATVTIAACIEVGRNHLALADNGRARGTDLVR